MKIKTTPLIKHNPIIWFDVEIPDTGLRDLIESIIFHLLAGILCFGGGFSLLIWFLSMFAPIKC